MVLSFLDPTSQPHANDAHPSQSVRSLARVRLRCWDSRSTKTQNLMPPQRPQRRPRAQASRTAQTATEVSTDIPPARDNCDAARSNRCIRLLKVGGVFGAPVAWRSLPRERQGFARMHYG